MNVRETLIEEAHALWADGTGTSLVAVASTWGLFVGVRMVLPVILPNLQNAYGLSLSVASLLVTVLWLFSSIGELPSGFLADRYSERTVMATGAATVAVALGFVVSASTPLVLFAAVAIWGLGHSMYPIARITVLSKLYPNHLGSALGVTMATGDVGQTILPPIATVIATAIAWQAGLGFVAPLLLVGALTIFFATPATETPTTDEDDIKSRLTNEDGNETGSVPNDNTNTFREIMAVLRNLRDPSLGFVTIINFLYMFSWQSVTALYPTYLTTVKGFSAGIASLLFGFFFAVGVVVKPVAGAAYDRIGMRGSLVAVLAPPAVGLALLPFVEPLWLLVPTTALISMMLGSGAVTQSFLADSFTEKRKGTGLGIIRGTTSAIGAAGPVVFGVLGDNGYFDQGYIFLAGIMAAVVLLTLRMPVESTESRT